MKQIFTLFTALMLITTLQSDIVATPTAPTPTVSPNPARDYLKVSWAQSQCDNVTIRLYSTKAGLVRTFTDREYCDGVYTQTYKIAGYVRGCYFMKITIGTQTWSYKVFLQ